MVKSIDRLMILLVLLIVEMGMDKGSISVYSVKITVINVREFLLIINVLIVLQINTLWEINVYLILGIMI